MPSESYDTHYFDPYLERGRFTKRLRGDRAHSYRYWISFLQRRKPPVSGVVEVGCGLGFLGWRICGMYNYTGIDLSLAALERARELHGIGSLICGSADALPLEMSSRDVIFAFDVIEHLALPALFFNEAHRVLRAGGILVLTTPNVRSLGVRVKSPTGSLIPAMYRDKTHVSLLPREQWMSALTTAGFVIENSGTDFLWDLPYFRGIPSVLQKAILIPFNTVFTRLFGFVRWSFGENLVIVARK